ncbi:MAG TPA: hypothetical protein VJ947_06070 [Pseudohaliea sp.]|nr:hypothetical protein [Pseudohaliea sp.]
MTRGHRHQRGVITILVSLLLMVLVSGVVLTAFRMSTTSLRAVGNMQSRDGAIAAAQEKIESSIQGGLFASDPNAARVFAEPFDINGDGTGDYLVDFARPICVRAAPGAGFSASSVLLPGVSVSGTWNTVWELRATAREPATNAEVTVVHAVRVLLDDATRQTNCPG